MVEFILEGFAFGDVTKSDYRARRCPVTHHRGGRVGDRDRTAVLASESGIVLPDGAAGAHSLPGWNEQEVGRRGSAVAHRVVDRDAGRRQFDHVGRGPIDEAQLPVGVYGADTFADVERDRGEFLALEADLLV